MEITNPDIDKLIDELEEPRKKDILILIELGRKITKKEPKLWGTIIGFGKLHYTYESNREGDMPEFGIASRKQAITLYMSYEINKYEELKNLGKYKTGQGCLYIKKLDDVDLDVLEQLITQAIKDLKSSSIIKEIA